MSTDDPKVPTEEDLIEHLQRTIAEIEGPIGDAETLTRVAIRDREWRCLDLQRGVHLRGVEHELRRKVLTYDLEFAELRCRFTRMQMQGAELEIARIQLNIDALKREAKR